MIIFIFITEDKAPISVHFIPDETNKTLLDVIHSLYPNMETLINMDKLYPYLIPFKLLTIIESEQLGPQSTNKTKTEKNLYFLSLLESKGPQGQEMFIKALYRTKELVSHRQLIELLGNKGVTFESCL